MSDFGISDKGKFMLCKIITLISITLIIILAFELGIYALNKYYDY